MDTYFDFQKSSLGAKYRYSRKPVIDEREIHPYHEILYYLDGNATFICDGFSKKLSPNTLILVPKDTYHFFKLEDPKNFERLKICFASLQGFEELLRRLFSSPRVLEELDEKILAIMNSFCENLSQNGDALRDNAFLHGSLLLMLSSIYIGEDVSSGSHRDRFVTESLHYIKNNLSEDLGAEAMANVLGVSASTLTHTFKTELGISLHKYVTQKRIALASRLMSDGKSPTKIFTECGFSDYSSFYKAYVKLTGHPPSRSDL